MRLGREPARPGSLETRTGIRERLTDPVRLEHLRAGNFQPGRVVDVRDDARPAALELRDQRADRRGARLGGELPEGLAWDDRLIGELTGQLHGTGRLRSLRRVRQHVECRVHRMVEQLTDTARAGSERAGDERAGQHPHTGNLRGGTDRLHRVRHTLERLAEVDVADSTEFADHQPRQLRDALHERRDVSDGILPDRLVGTRHDRGVALRRLHADRCLGLRIRGRASSDPITVQRHGRVTHSRGSGCEGRGERRVGGAVLVDDLADARLVILDVRRGISRSAGEGGTGQTRRHEAMLLVSAEWPP